MKRMTWFLILTRRTPNFREEVVGEHRAYLRELADQGRLGLSGPFADGSGGAYLVRAADLEEARQTALADPLYARGASALTVKEWQTVEPEAYRGEA